MKDNNKGLPEQLSRHINVVDQERELENFNSENCKQLRRLLQVHCEHKHIEAIRLTEKRSNYTGSGWPYAQADSIGYRRCLNDIINILRG